MFYSDAEMKDTTAFLHDAMPLCYGQRCFRCARSPSYAGVFATDTTIAYAIPPASLMPLLRRVRYSTPPIREIAVFAPCSSPIYAAMLRRLFDDILRRGAAFESQRELPRLHVTLLLSPLRCPRQRAMLLHRYERCA